MHRHGRQVKSFDTPEDFNRLFGVRVGQHDETTTAHEIPNAISQPLLLVEAKSRLVVGGEVGRLGGGNVRRVEVDKVTLACGTRRFDEIHIGDLHTVQHPPKSDELLAVGKSNLL